jgi:Magnesium transporter NIPA
MREQGLSHHLCCLRSAVLAHYLLQEKLNVFGVLGCVLCIVGSIVIVLHAPGERQVRSVMEIWAYAMRPGALRRPPAAPSPLSGRPAFHGVRPTCRLDRPVSVVTAHASAP